jgi:hypothetical protein
MILFWSGHMILYQSRSRCNCGAATAAPCLHHAQLTMHVVVSSWMHTPQQAGAAALLRKGNDSASCDQAYGAAPPPHAPMLHQFVPTPCRCCCEHSMQPSFCSTPAPPAPLLALLLAAPSTRHLVHLPRLLHTHMPVPGRPARRIWCRGDPPAGPRCYPPLHLLCLCCRQV